jgi:hypothetical protein
MSRAWLVGLVGGLVMLFGLACLNYTKQGTWEHHREQASRHGWTPPSRGIYLGGLFTTVLGSATVGFVAGRSASGRVRAS